MKRPVPSGLGHLAADNEELLLEVAGRDQGQEVDEVVAGADDEIVLAKPSGT